MLSLPPSVRIFVALDATDMRKSFDGLAGEVRRLIERDPLSLSGHLFVFFKRRRTIHGRELGAEPLHHGLPRDRGARHRAGCRYADVITMWLSDAARRALEELMSLHGYELQSEFAKKYAAEGRKEGSEEGQRKILIKQLTLKFGELPEGILQKSGPPMTSTSSAGPSVFSSPGPWMMFSRIET